MSIFKNYNDMRRHGGYPYSNRHMTAEKPHFGRFNGRHRASFLGASPSCHCKQFDIRRAKAHRHFRGKTSNPLYIYGTVWGFGKIKHKFLYKASQKM